MYVLVENVSESSTLVYTPAQVADLHLFLDVNPFLPFRGYDRVMTIPSVLNHDWDEGKEDHPSGQDLHDESLGLHLGVAESVRVFLPLCSCF